MELGARDTSTAGRSCRATQGTVVLARHGSFESTRANVHSALVRRVPVTGDWGVFGQRQVGLGLLNIGRLVGVLVDD